MPAEDRVAAVVVAFNGGDDLIACVRSLLDQTLRDLEIIVVDNASIDGSIERLIQEVGAGVRVIRRDTNGGYAAGANTGWRATKAPIVGIFNQDLAFAPDCLERMRQVLLDEPSEALVTPKLVLKSDPTRVNAVGMDVHLSGVAWCHGLGTPAADWHGVKEVTAISGAAFMARSSFLQELGGLEEAYFMYVEDVDLSLRAWIAGGKCLAACDAVALHDWEFTITPSKFALLERNRQALWWRLWAGQRRMLPVLVQTEAMSWAYAILHGLPYVAAKVQSFRSDLSVPRHHVDSKRQLLKVLARQHPYALLFRGPSLLWRLGQSLDRAATILVPKPKEATRPDSDQSTRKRSSTRGSVQR